MRNVGFRLAVLLAASLAVTPLAAGGSPPPRPVEGPVVPTGTAPCGISARAGSLWIGVYETGKLLVLDERNGRLEASVDVGRWACRVAVGPAAAWVTRDRAGELVRVSRGTGRVERMKVGTGTFDVLLAHGSVWTTSHEHAAIVRIDARTRRLTRVYKHGPYPAGLASCAGRVVVGHGRAVTFVTSIDPSTHRMRRIDVGTAAPGWPVCIRGVVWVTTPDTIVRIEPRSGLVLTRLQVGETLAHAAEGPDGLVWVTDKQHSLVHRLTLEGNLVVDSFPAGPGAFALARVGNSMWVTSFAGSDVRRFDHQG
jgi:streptogramin lyase